MGLDVFLQWFESGGAAPADASTLDESLAPYVLEGDAGHADRYLRFSDGTADVFFVRAGVTLTAPRAAFQVRPRRHLLRPDRRLLRRGLPSTPLLANTGVGSPPATTNAPSGGGHHRTRADKQETDSHETEDLHT
jgi:hypothetical protein